MNLLTVDTNTAVIILWPTEIHPDFQPVMSMSPEEIKNICSIFALANSFMWQKWGNENIIC